MIDREKLMTTLQYRINEARNKGSKVTTIFISTLSDCMTLLKEQESLLGIQQTADSITFISTGTAQQGENRGLLIGKYAMHEWLERELLYRGLLTDDIRAVFDEAKRQEGR